MSPDRAGVAGGTLDSLDASTGAVRETFAVADAPAVAAAVASARAAQPAWAALGARVRAALLRAFAERLLARRADVAATIAAETGKSALEALSSEISVVLDFARFYARVAPGELAPGRWRRPGSPAMWRKRVRELREPYGVVGVISPWNYPFMLAAGQLLPALVAGNAVVLKPSELTPACGALLASLLHDAGVPRSVLLVLQGGGATGALVAASSVDKVFFTGSVATGRRVALACAERLAPCALELGGSDAAIVLDDADPASAARGIAWGRFTNAGQTCVAPKRVFATAVVHDRFLAALGSVVDGISLRAGTEAGDVGPLIRRAQRETLEAQLDDAVARGARVAATAAAPPGASAAWPAHFPPTVLADVPDDARVLREETFGPLLPVVRVADADEAVRRANDSAFGLSASVWGRDRAGALAVAERLEAGTVAVNDVVIVAGMADVAHGGIKQSGTGRAHGVEGLRECVRTKTVVDERLPRVPQAWWFGGPAGERELDAFIALVHGRGRARLDALRGLLARRRRP